MNVILLCVLCSYVTVSLALDFHCHEKIFSVERKYILRCTFTDCDHHNVQFVTLISMQMMI